MGSRHSMDIRPIRQKNTPSTMVPVLGPDGRITSSPSVLPMRTCLEGSTGSADLAGSADLTEPVGRAERPAKLPRMSCPEVSSDSASSCDSNSLCASGPPSNGFWNDSVFASPGSSTAGRVSVGSSETSAIPMTSVNGTSRVFSSLISFPFRWRFSRRSFHRRCHAIGRPSFPLAACCRTCTAW